MPLQVMSPDGPSAPTAPGPQEVGGEHVEGHQDLIPALQASGTVNGISPPGREGLVLQASEGNQGLAPSGLAQAPPQGAGLVPTRVGGESSPGRTHPFTTALSQYGSTEPFKPVQMEVSTSTTVVEQAQAGLRQGFRFRWLGEIVHRTTGVGLGSIKLIPCRFHHRCHQGRLHQVMLSRLGA